MHFRLNSDKYNHVRIVFSFYEWIGLIGGGLYVIKSFFFYVLGDFLSFNSMIEVMSELYSKDKNKPKEEMHSTQETKITENKSGPTDFLSAMKSKIN